MKIMYVNGCSHSNGFELTVPGKRSPEDLADSWSGQLAMKMSLDHFNEAVPGQSNWSIYSNTVNSVNKLLKEYKPEDIFVVIGWSSFDRYDYIHEFKQLYRITPGSIDSTAATYWPQAVKDAYRIFVLGCDYNSHSLNNFALIYQALSSFLKLKNIKYFFFNAIQNVRYPERNLLHSLRDNAWDKDLFDSLKNDPDYLNPFNKDSVYVNYLGAKYDRHEGGRNFHFTKPAHTEWANFLYEKIQERL